MADEYDIFGGSAATGDYVDTGMEGSMDQFLSTDMSPSARSFLLQELDRLDNSGIMQANNMSLDPNFKYLTYMDENGNPLYSNEPNMGMNLDPEQRQLTIDTPSGGGGLEFLANLAKKIGAVDDKGNVNWGKLLGAALTGYGVYGQTQRANANTERNNATNAAMDSAMQGALNRISQRAASGYTPLFDTSKLGALVTGGQSSAGGQAPVFQQVQRNAVPIANNLTSPRIAAANFIRR